MEIPFSFFSLTPVAPPGFVFHLEAETAQEYATFLELTEGSQEG